MAENQDYLDLYALQTALGEWPKLPSRAVLHLLSEAGNFKKDWERGKRMQRELPFGVIPYVCECEIGAGFWDRITNGAWREHLVAPPQQEAKDE